LAAQKAAERQQPRNIDAARWERDRAAYWLQRQRAVDLIRGALGHGPFRPFHTWPMELAAECDAIARALKRELYD